MNDEITFQQGYVARLARWSLHKIGARTLLRFLLLCVVLGSVTGGLASSVPELRDASLALLTFLALLSGWLLARSRLPDWKAAPVAALSGLLFALASAGHLAGPAYRLGVSLLQPGLELLRWQTGDALPDLTQVATLTSDLLWRANAVLWQARLWLESLLHGQAAYDPLVALLVWELVLWGLAGWAAWSVRRRQQPLAGMAPAVALLAASLSYTRQPVLPLLASMWGALMLLGWDHFSRQEDRWQRQATDSAEDLPFDMSIWNTAFVMLITGAALGLSYFSPQQTFSAARRLLLERSAASEQVGQSLGLEGPIPSPQVPTGLGSGVLPRQHLVGAGPELSLRPALTVSLTTTSTLPLPRLYWRSLSYDVYTGRGWVTSPTEVISYLPGQAIAFDDGRGMRLSQYVQVASPADRNIYFAGQLLAIDQDSQAAWRPVQIDPEETAPGDLFGALRLEASQSLTYTAGSRLPLAGEAQLRAASQQYDAWLAERYLQLPAGLPGRLHDLADRLTENAPTAFDKALAIESYLRAYPYSLNVPTPPPGSDVADYFLFDLQSGYCDYYATAMVVLARASGLPARLVIGYAGGTPGPGQATYHVTQADAHSWVEIYFPGLGWIEFEPTAGQPALQRPADIPLPESPVIPSPITPPAPPAWQRWARWASGLIALAAGLALLWLVGDVLLLRRLRSQTALANLYGRLYRRSQRLDMALHPDQTPHEFAAALEERLGHLNAGRRWSAPPFDLMRQETRCLVDLYARAFYGPAPLETPDLYRAIQAWRRLRWRLWLAKLFSVAEKIRHRV